MAIGKDGQFRNFANNFAQTYPYISEELAGIILAYRYSKSLYLFTKLDLAECFKEAPITINELA